jgi:hypothetical protein
LAELSGVTYQIVEYDVEVRIWTSKASTDSI